MASYAVYGSDDDCDRFRVYRNSIESSNYGIRLSYGDEWLIANNTIKWCTHGIYLLDSFDTEVYYNTLAWNTEHNG
jgi:parallel beta-helix repeat protein